MKLIRIFVAVIAVAAMVLASAGGTGLVDRAQAQNAPTDYEILEILYRSALGGTWTDTTNWLSDRPAGEWYGVTTDGHGNVTGLDLSSNQLTGEIPAELGDLSNLTVLTALAGVFTPHSPVAAQGVHPTATATPTATSLPILTPATPVPTASSDRAAGAAQADGLFYDVKGEPPPSIGVDTLASRLVGIDFGLLAQVIDAPVSPKDPVTGKLTKPQTLALNLFDDVVFTGTVEHVERTSSGHALGGRLDGVGLGTFTLVVNGRVVIGTVRMPDAVYTIRTAGDGTYVIRQIDESSLLPLGEPLEGPLSTPEARSESDGIPPDNGSMIDVMVVYTPLAKHREGGRAAIEALIDLFVVETNQAYVSSGVKHRIRLVLREEVDYTENGISIIDLGRLQDDSDGYMDDVHERRDMYGADLVHILVGRSDFGGRAHWNRGDSAASDEPFGFGLTNSMCGGLCFAHELGHNMGLGHDRYELGVPLTGSNYGYVNQRMFAPGAPVSTRWRTIMAYNLQCKDVGGFYCDWIGYFSNPDVTHNGDPMGVPADHPSTGVDGPADAVGTLSERREITANFRRSSASPTPRVHLTLSPYWLSENGGVSTVTATLHRPSSVDTILTVSASPSDAVALSGRRTLTIPAGQTVSVGSVTITGVDNGDQTGDVNVTVSATATNPSSLGVIAPEPVELAVADDETMPVVTLSLSTSEIAEHEGRTFVTATLGNRSVTDTTVTVSAEPADAVVEISSNPLTIPAGQTKSIGLGVWIRAVDNHELAEATQTVTVSGTSENAQGVAGPENVTLTIIDNEAPFFAADSIVYTFTAGIAGGRFLPEAAYGNGKLTYSLSLAPSNDVTFTPGPPAWVGTSSTSIAGGETSYTLTATDADGDTDTMTISITVRKGVCPNSAAVSGYSDTGIVDNCEALLVSTGVLGGDKSLNWAADTPMSEWDGVTVGGTPLRVTLLSLSDRGLTGQIPTELGNLSNLARLDLGGNQLTGPIPTELGGLVNLEVLSLSVNQLTGPIPTELGGLVNLERLFLSRNQLTGPIPTELGGLVNLEQLSLWGNQLTGPIPTELGGLVNLEILYLSENQLTGPIPTELGGLVNLEWLFLTENQLTGPIPVELGNLSNLQALYLRGNLLTGCVPDGLREVPRNDFARLGLPFCSEHPCVIGGAVVDATDLGLIADCGTLLTARDTLAGTATLNWSADTPITDWSGVVLGGMSERVTELRLGDLGLNGRIPTELDSLTNLQYLNLSDNQLTGGIPTELGNLSNLQALYLSGNLLTGCVPDGLREVPRNDVAGLELPSCSELPCVSGGAVVDTTNLGLMSDCVIMLEARDTLAGTASLNWVADTPMSEWDGVTLGGTPARVTQLSLHDRGLTGVIPRELGNLSNQTTLSLWGNQLTGPIPTELGGLVNLEWLFLSGNQLTGPIPTELGGLVNLEWLDLGRNQLTGPIPTELGGLVNLERLSLWGNQLTGPIPTELGGLVNLKRLDLSGNQLTGPIPTELGGLVNLEWLFLTGNQLTGPVPAWLGGLVNLERLFLWGNQLTGPIPTELGGLVNLKRLDLSGNQLTGPIPTELGGLVNLELLFLTGNQLTGPIPTELGGLVNLEELFLWGNQLTGPIPTELGGLVNLKRLDLSGNQLTGPIPTELGGLVNLEVLFLTGNQLTGPIPTELGGLVNLELLFLWGNQLTGPIPTELGGLVNLKRLDLTGNQLTGPIPVELTSLANLVAVYLSQNQLTGCIPEGLRDVTDNDLEDLDLPFCDVLLSGLTISPGSTTPPFNPYHTDYAVVVGQSQVTVTLTIDHNSTLHFLDENHVELADADDALDGHQVDLGLGVTTISISVISQDGRATLIYTIQISRATLPGAPVVSVITAGRGSLNVAWTAPSQAAGQAVTAYDLRHVQAAVDETVESNWTVVEDIWTAATGGALEYTITGLTGGTQYDVQVRAVSGSSTRPWSTTVAGTPTQVTTSDCATGTAVVDATNNPGLVSDCNALLAARDALVGSAPLNWSATIPIADWDGVTVGGRPRRVTALDLSENQLTGPIPTELGGLVNLEQLSLWGNQLTGPIPTELGGLVNLEQLSLWGNQLTGPIPTELGGLVNLKRLDLSLNQLTGPIPTELGGLVNLEQLELSLNQLTGPIPTELGGLVNLERLFLTENQLTGPIPPELGGLVNLEQLFLTGNQLTGPIPTELGGLVNLELLFLWGNQLTGPIPTELGGLVNLKRLDLSGNQLTGPIPTELGGLVNLEVLFLPGNQLTGPIPTELSGLVNLEVLYLFGNQLTGPIPTELGGLVNLKRLDLSVNQLTGPIPTELGGLVNLEVLELSVNQLTGPIPTELGGLVNLERLFLTENQLTGPIPVELTSLANLVAVYLSPNQLTGCIPEGLRDVTDNDLEDLDLPFCDVLLSGLTISPGSTTPPFNPYHTDYAVVVGQSQVTVTPTIDHNSTLRFLDENDVELADADDSLDGHQVDLGLGVTTISISVISQDGRATLIYTIQISRATLPGAPVVSVITPGRGSLTVAWTAPSQTAGQAVTAYDLRHVQAAVDETVESNWTVVEDIWTAATGGALEYTITGLTGGTQYDVQVRAVSGSSTRPWSTAVAGTPTQVTTSDCATGTAVVDATNNPGLVSDCNALLAARDALVGSAPLNWSETIPIADWDGVTVGGRPRRVTALDLSENQLTGPIPTELGGLVNLEDLSLWGNQLTGPVPAWLGGLVNLKQMFLSGNQLTGPIPTELGGLVNLEWLDLSGNQLTGPIPTELGGLINLKQLFLSGNQLTGPIPTELGGLVNLEGLDLSVNQLTGPVPAWLGGLVNLELLELSGNQLTGPIPTELGGLVNLKWLFLTENQLTGPIPTELGGLVNLEQLSLWGNQLTGPIPAELGGLVNLEWLDLSGNQLTGPIPAWLGGLVNLVRLSLSRNQLTGPIPTELGGLVNLEVLYLSGNQLTGPIPTELSGLINLVRLSLTGNQLTGPIPTELGGLVNLVSLSLSRNQLTGLIPTELGGLVNLELLFLFGNQLTGPIPTELGGLVSLKYLFLWGNQLTGPIPTELGGLVNLVSLALSRNQLTGLIPTELGGLVNLERLSLSENQLTGPIPVELTSLANLVAVYLSQNQLTGCIPEGLRDVTDNDLEDLDLPFCDVLLSGLTISPGSTTPPFNPYHTDYAVVVGQSQVTVTPTIDHNSTLHFLDENGVEVADADDSLDGHQVDLGLGVTTISISVISQDGRATLIYTIQISRATNPGDVADALLILRYDANRNMTIDKSEVLTAVNDYLFGVGDDAISKAEVLRLIELYLFG